MIVRIDESFVKDKKILLRIADCIENVRNAANIKEIKDIQKMKGSKSSFRIRIGDYRVGLVLEKNVFDFVRFLPRKDIYKFFGS